MADVEWMGLDNAAKIYPAAKRRGWTALFRLSATLTEQVDKAVLIEAQRRAISRFPGFSFVLRHGMFWYYLEKSEEMPEVQEDVRNPCVTIELHPKS